MLQSFLHRICLGLAVVCLTGASDWVRADALPAASERAPVVLPHFPDPLHAVVWRNWGLVEPEQLARVLSTSPANVRELAGSMGLPTEINVPPAMRRRGYITLIRRNWHLLPYDQLAALLQISPEQLAFTLREDDFLYIKLGRLKPKCKPVRYAEPTPAARQRAAEIRQIVDRQFGPRLLEPAEERFAFVDDLSQMPPAARRAPPTGSHAAGVTGPRFIYSYFALFGDPLSDPSLDPYPDGLLARLQALGVNGVWLHVVLRQLAPGGPDFPEWGEGHEHRLANLRQLVTRAKQYGIDIYLYMNEPRAMPAAFFANRPHMAGTEERGYRALCTSNPEVRAWLTDSLAHVFREVPGLGGIFTITASENFTHCASHGNHAQCPRCRNRTDADIIAEVNAAMAAGVHQSAPDAKVIAWDWGWRQHGDASEIIARLAPPMWLMSVSEWALPIRRGGVDVRVGEYSISATGPGPRAQAHWRVAREHGLPTVAKVQLNNTWELASVPYLPVMDLVARHCANLARAEVDGMMLSWSLGGYPSLNLELAQRFSQRPVPDVEDALDELATQHFGARAAPAVRRAWTRFSRAFEEFPYHGSVLYNGPQQMGPANLLYAAPTGYAATMVGFPYDDLARWRGPYPPEILAAQFEKVAEGWAAGLVELEAAQAAVPAGLRPAALADLRVAKAAHLHFASAANQVRFVLARERLLASREHDEQQRLRQELIELLEHEMALASRLFDLAIADSRLGYEASNHYYYVPLDLVEKVINCHQLRAQYAARSTDFSP